ncbi:hypothetical protein [Pseudomonas sp.]|uniref:hypothetical protein n=1 Tax=Pseudomonas sp. TaxID=306 RepID=UPI003D118A3D
MPAATGLYTTDNVPVQQLYTEFIRSIELYNRERNSFRDVLCEVTRKRTARVAQRSMAFRPAGSDTAQPDVDRLVYREINLPEPVAYELAEGFTKKAIERGVSSEEMRAQHQEALNADRRLIQQLVLKAMLVSGGFWDGNMSVAPPSYKSNSFQTSHTHYLAQAAAGVPTLAMFAELKQHILEHGYGDPLNGGALVAFINSANAQQIENAAEWQTTSNYVATRVIEQLQSDGLWPASVGGQVMSAVGVPIIVEDWVPENYILMVDYKVRPLRWRLPEGPGVEGLIVDTDDDFRWLIKRYRRWGSVKVVHRGAGACYYINGANYTDPTFEV